MTSTQRAVDVSTEADVLMVRQALRSAARSIGLSLVNETKFVTAGSELVRNILQYATGGLGTVTVEWEPGALRPFVRATFSDDGPGITDVDRALTDGFSSAKGLGIGLPGAKRLVHAFALESSPAGTSVEIVMWAA